VTLAKFIAEADFANQTEISRTCLLAFYYLKKDGIAEFTASDYAKWIEGHNFGKPNTHRLTERLRKNRNTVKGSKPGAFRLQHKYLLALEAKFPQLSEKSQEVIDHGTILPPILYEKTRGYIESLAKQINASYEYNIFDGCAVLMRRLEEVLLTMSYEHLGITAAIKDAATGTYYMLERIVNDAIRNPTLNLSRNSQKSVEGFRELGNYSAHKITYTCKREYKRRSTSTAHSSTSFCTNQDCGNDQRASANANGASSKFSVGQNRARSPGNYGKCGNLGNLESASYTF